jgi:hypothetical protein
MVFEFHPEQQSFGIHEIVLSKANDAFTGGSWSQHWNFLPAAAKSALRSNGSPGKKKSDSRRSAAEYGLVGMSTA